MHAIIITDDAQFVADEYDEIEEWSGRQNSIIVDGVFRVSELKSGGVKVVLDKDGNEIELPNADLIEAMD